jgi:hypothetical protein
LKNYRYFLLQVQHVENSPPHIMDHCYARPAPAPRSRRASSLSSDDSDAAAASRGGGGGGGFDHDYTKPRTPPRAVLAPVNSTAPTAERKAVPVPRKSAAPTSRLPSQPVKFKVRDVTDKFKILYKFLTDGIDLEDVMYLKRSYEMVSRIIVHSR